MNDNVLALPERPEPPEHLTPDEQAEWRKIVATKPAEWFMRDTQPILAALCQAIIVHRQLMEKWYRDGGEVNLVHPIHKMAGLIATLSTKLRLTNQSRYTPRAANTASKKRDGRPLWQKLTQ